MSKAKKLSAVLEEIGSQDVVKPASAEFEVKNFNGHPMATIPSKKSPDKCFLLTYLGDKADEPFQVEHAMCDGSDVLDQATIDNVEDALEWIKKREGQDVSGVKAVKDFINYVNPTAISATLDMAMDKISSKLNSKPSSDQAYHYQRLYTALAKMAGTNSALKSEVLRTIRDYVKEI